ncbi:alanine dehydrogenase/PNT domain protein [Hymenobacter roseosalivarius DSM 11622]|uniref:Saccharopine dehydrogenase [NAD(+), L-lysine-forming] n=1 Tax=Hymenobacter roseosalivarius DSM 11622 TaxID=645990 RepID=A0A1W1VNP3_9BACT|nr:NAD(P)-dependent oxidoreductase [Hymenobacter roseosalivarius]SMB94989.1 alanine dehydrogenase/PNT domain protein [Hymenobacter roseosalivarius DSM 11622]
MRPLTIGIIREGKTPPDLRVTLTPKKCVEAETLFPGLHIVVQECPSRSFKDQEYRDLGIEVRAEVADCDLLLGVKEVPPAQLIPNKTYMFFSHTVKKQPANRELLRQVLKKNITLIDYELLTNEQGERIVAFGRWAGIVGAYNGLLTYGRKHQLYELKPAYQCVDMEDMQEEFFKVKKLPPIKLAVTGSGRVAQGAIEVLDKMGIRRVSVYDYLYLTFHEPVYTQLRSSDYNRRRDGRVWDTPDFHRSPQEYESTFGAFLPVTDMLLACAYWHPAAPRLFSEADTRRPDFRITTIADITCDVNGSIPTTKRSTSIQAPAFDYNPQTSELEPPYSRPTNITVMAVDNLPCELPRNASRDFGRQLLDNVFPYLGSDKPEPIIERASIAAGGKLTERYAYLADYVAE